MELSPGVVLSGKYIIQLTLYETDMYYAYLAKAPTLGEEFVITEYIPQHLVERDENDYITMSPEVAEDFEKRLDKFIRDSNRMMHMTLNRFFGIKEVFSEKGTAYVVTRKPVGDIITQFVTENPMPITTVDNAFDIFYESYKNAVAEGITVALSPDYLYADSTGTLTFLYYYAEGQSEAELTTGLARLMYFLTTGKVYADGEAIMPIDENIKYGEAITEILQNNDVYKNFIQIDKSISKWQRNHSPNEPFKVYYKSALFLFIVLVAITAACIFGVYQLAKLILG